MLTERIELSASWMSTRRSTIELREHDRGGAGTNLAAGDCILHPLTCWFYRQGSNPIVTCRPRRDSRLRRRPTQREEGQQSGCLNESVVGRHAMGAAFATSGAAMCAAHTGSGPTSLVYLFPQPGLSITSAHSLSAPLTGHPVHPELHSGSRTRTAVLPISRSGHPTKNAPSLCFRGRRGAV